ncbi:hypothetical protein [Microlunatus sp. Y2014]|uniref:hypothetical protein n=1 Tax=Microlunatus sp. Y2014 TaxID=3418488 RepID=UPI003DA74977
MAEREPDDAEVDAAFAEIVSRLRSADSAERLWDAASIDLPRHDDPATASSRHGAPPEVTTGADHDDTDHHDTADHDTDDDLATDWRFYSPPDDDELPDEPLPSTPLPPWRPSLTTLIALLGMMFGVAVTVLLLAGVRLPGWAGWTALIGFAGGMLWLFSQLPSGRDESDDDGARV